jgi:hypothetical protein
MKVESTNEQKDLQNLRQAMAADKKAFSHGERIFCLDVPLL